MRFPEFEGEWEKKRLGGIGDVKMCRRVFNNETSPTGDIPFFKIGSFGKVADAFISKELYLDYKNRFSFPKQGDILISAAGTIGRTVVYDGEDAYFQDSNIVWIENDNKMITNNFLYYIFQIVKYNTEGGTIQRLYNNILKSTKFNAPSITEQNKIASFLSLIDERISTQNKIIEQYETLIKGIGEKLFSQQFKFSGFTENWNSKKLGEIFYSEKGRGLSKEKVQSDGKYECILYGELYTKYKEVIVDIKSKTNEEDGLKSQIGDLLIPSSTTTTGIDLANVTAINKENVLLGGDITILRSKEEINNVFYAYYLSNYKKEEIANYAQGTTIVHLYYYHIRNMLIDFPPMEEQTIISQFLLSIDSKIKLENNILEQYQFQKQFLLQNLFI